MKKTALFLLMILPLYVAFAQTVKGKIENDAGKPISKVNIYLDGTKTGTISADDGTFALNLPSGISNSLIFQKDGFETNTVNTEEVLNKTLKVILLQAREIEEVQIIPFTDAAYRDYIQYFLDTFIGNDQENVKIKNLRTLKFAYDRENKVLKVKAPQTLKIENKNLGYTINYNLVEFTADFENKITRYLGTSFFTETKNTDKIKLNRMNAFEGIQEHFFRCVYAGTVSAEGFTVNQITKYPNSKYPTEDELQLLKDFAKNLKAKTTLSVPADLMDIANRKRNEPPYKIAVTKPQIPETDYTKRKDGRLFLDYDYMIQINYRKYFYELKKGRFVKSEIPVTQTSYIHSDGEVYEIYPDGNNSEPGQLTNQGEFANNTIEKLLPLGYQLGD